MMWHTFNQPLGVMAAAVSLIGGGVLERFPELRVALLEGNCSWAPWLLHRLDEHHEWVGWYEARDLTQKPSEYFRNNCFVSVEADEETVVHYLDWFGDDNLVFSTDYPHGDSQYPHAVETLPQAAALRGIAAQDRRRQLEPPVRHPARAQAAALNVADLDRAPLLVQESRVTWLQRALAVGAGFGLAAAAIDLAFGALGVVHDRMGPGPFTLAGNALWMVALGAVIGLLSALALRSQSVFAPFLHLALVCGVWSAVEHWVAIESPLHVAAAGARTFGAGALVLVALLLERFARRLAALPWAFAALAVIAGVIAPSVYLSATTPAAAHAALPPARAGAPDVVLVVLDTVRADRMASYGHIRDTSPTFDALAREGALYVDATSPATWSLPSHASLFTGRYPSSHGANRAPSILDSRFPTLAEVLAAHGYETYCFTANPWISDGLGLTRGFAVQDLSWKSRRGTTFAGRVLDRIGLGEVDKGGGAAADDFTAWRARSEDARPTFVFLNFVEAHYPYHQLPRAFRDRYTDRPASELRKISLEIGGQQLGGPGVDVAAITAPARDLYDGGVAYTDALLGRVVDALRDSGRLDHTVLVALADHGEILGEHGDYFGHGPSLYQSGIRVPLLVRYPPRIARGTRVTVPVSTLGVFATILDLAEIEPPPTLQVGSLARAGDGDAGGPILSELFTHGNPGAPSGREDPLMFAQRQRAYRSGSWKLVETTTGGPYLYDLARDPNERRDLAHEHPADLARLTAELESARTQLRLPNLGEVGSGSSVELDAATQQRLRELGYVK